MIPEGIFWLYTGWVWFKGTFGHSIIRSIGFTYAIAYILMSIVIFVWISYIMNGKLIMKGKYGVLGKFEKIM